MMPELTPQQALEEFEGGLSYSQMEKKYNLSNHSVQSLVKRGRRERDGESEDASPPKLESLLPPENQPIRVPEAPPPQELFKVILPIPFDPISGGGPFNIGDILCVESFPHRKYSERRLRNLLIEGKLIGI